MVKHSHAAWRIGIVCAVTVILAGIALPDVVLPWQPFSTFAFDTNATGLVLDVTPGSGAAAAGLHPGDTIDIPATSLAARRYLVMAYMVAVADQRATFVVDGADGTRRDLTLVAQPRARTVLDNVADLAQQFSYAVFLIIAGLLVLIRPSGLTWAFFAYSCCEVGIGVVAEAHAPFVVDIALLAAAAVQSLGWLPFAIFALRFPTDQIDGWRLTVQRALIGAAIGLVPLAAYTILGVLFSWPFVQAANGLLLQLLPIAGFVLGATIFIGTYLHAAAIDRPRIRWVILGFFLGYGGNVIAGVIALAGLGLFPIWLNDFVQTLNVAVPITVAYAIVKHRVIDIQFYLNRALVYGLLTTMALAVMALLHWFVSKQLDGYHLGALPEILGAVAIGFSILKVHGWLETIVDRFVFRSFHAAEQHLITTGESMMYAQSVPGLDRLVCAEPRRALDLAWTAVFHVGEDGSYRRAEMSGDDERAHLAFDRDDPIVLAMASSRRPVTTPDSSAFPFVIRDEMLGFALFSVHANGSAIDPNEREVLGTFVHRASIAYDHLISKARAAENSRLRIENETLRSLITSR